jgi:ribonuclease HI
MKIYTDGSCRGNPGPGGWAAIAVSDDDTELFRVCGGDDNTTNNIMELTAIINGLKRHGFGEVTVYTDSKYVMDGITKWIFGWKKNGWKTSTGKDVKNKSLWMELDSVSHSMVSYRWVKAHNGDKWNEKVDSLALEVASRILKGRHLLEN